jgi:hypothetical protein
MAKATTKDDDAPKGAAEIPPGGSGGAGTPAPVDLKQLETEQEKLKLDKSIGGPSAEEAEKLNKVKDAAEAKAAKKAAKEE